MGLSTYGRVRPTSSTSLARLSQTLAPIGGAERDDDGIATPTRSMPRRGHLSNGTNDEIDSQCQTSPPQDVTPPHSRSLPQLENLPSTQGDVWKCLPSKSPP